MPNPPSGTVTFLFTDIEGSTSIAQQHPEHWEALRARHNAILRQAIQVHDGYVFQIVGDSFCVAFHTASEAVNAAVEAQRRLLEEAWDPAPVRVRMGINTGAAQASDSDDRSGGYTGYTALARVQRVMSVAHGGQILLSNASAELARGGLGQGVTLLDLQEHRLKSLFELEHLWQVVGLGLRQEFPPLQSLQGVPNNLPLKMTSFIGREAELAQIKRRLVDGRLVTLTGSGGIGKTRLAIQVAGESLADFRSGAWLVELAPLADPELLVGAVASAFGLRDDQERSVLEVLTDYLREKTLLLVLDNCEHLIEACAMLVEHLLGRCPNLRVLASSREALGVEGEIAVRVPSLSLPPTGQVTSEALQACEAAQFFVARGAVALPGFAMTDANAGAIAQVCRRLDGIPLALELAAARVKMLKVEQIAARLDDAFRLLTGGSRTALPRQQTLRATLDWSYSLLPEVERTVLRRLSVFAGGWSLEAAEATCSGDGVEVWELLDLLGGLANKSLVVIERQSGEEARYHLLETTRQYVREKLMESGASEAVRQRHLEYYLKLAEQAERKIQSAERLEWELRMEPDWDNFRAALEWSLSEASPHSPEKGLRLANAFNWILPNNLQAHVENIAWIQKGLALVEGSSDETNLLRAEGILIIGSLTEDATGYPAIEKGVALYRENPLTDPRDLARALGWLGEEAFIQNGDLALARESIAESVSICRALGASGRWELADALHMAGWAAYWGGDYLEAQERGKESHVIFLETGDIVHAAWSLRPAAVAAEAGKDYAAAQTYLEQAMQLLQGVAPELQAHIQDMAMIFNLDLAILERRVGRYAGLNERLEQVLAFYQNLGDRRMELLVYIQLGLAALAGHAAGRAAGYLREGLRLGLELKHSLRTALCLARLAEVFRAAGQLAPAARCLGAVESYSNGWNSLTQDEYHASLEAVKAALDEEAFMVAYAEGQAMSLEQAAAYAMLTPVDPQE